MRITRCPRNSAPASRFWPNARSLRAALRAFLPSPQDRSEGESRPQWGGRQLWYDIAAKPAGRPVRWQGRRRTRCQVSRGSQSEAASLVGARIASGRSGGTRRLDPDKSATTPDANLRPQDDKKSQRMILYSLLARDNHIAYKIAFSIGVTADVSAQPEPRQARRR